MNKPLRIALTKGRLQDKSVELFEKVGLDCTPIHNPGRRLIHALPNYPLDAVLAKGPDVITYVEHGVCDMGIVGKDTILEKGGIFYEVLDLKFGKCRFALAVKNISYCSILIALVIIKITLCKILSCFSSTFHNCININTCSR